MLSSLQAERVYSPHSQAMLAALRLVLALPQIPIILEGEKHNQNETDLLSLANRACMCTDRTDQGAPRSGEIR